MKRYPLHHEDARPMFSTVESDYLDELHESKKLIESLTIRRYHLSLIKDSLNKARTKHPHFCDFLTTSNEDFFIMRTKALQNFNEEDAKRGLASAEMILEEEVSEMFLAHKQGNKQESMEECADAIAVLVRIMEELDK